MKTITLDTLAVTALRRFYPSSWVRAMRQALPINHQVSIDGVAEIQIIRICDLREMELGVEYYMGHTPMQRAEEMYLRRCEEDERFETIRLDNVDDDGKNYTIAVFTYQMVGGEFVKANKIDARVFQFQL